MTVIEVAAAILMRRQSGCTQTEFLLAKRPPDKVYAGYWEFPGGKVEAGETSFAALIRELDEELGIQIEQAYPWLSLQYTYPHATVRLKFFHIHAWRGEIRPIEHTGLIWTAIGQTPDVSPVLPANGPILRALELPNICMVTHPGKTHEEAELSRLHQALEDGLKLVLIVDKRFEQTDREHFAKQVMHRARAHDGVMVLVEDDEALARRLQADGLYLSSARLASATERPSFAWTTALCHDANELAKAVALGLDFAVLDTGTHHDSAEETTHWAVFSNLVETSPIPVFALSRSGHHHLELARLNGAHGIVLIPEQ